MTKLSADWARAHGAGALRVSGSSPSAKGADVFGALWMYMVQGLALEILYDSESVWGFGSVRDDDRVVAGSGLYNHLQSSRERNTSRAHSRSTLSANPSPASLSRCSVTTILFPWGKGRCSSRVARKGVGPSSQLEDGVDGSVGGRERVGGGGVPLGSREVGISRSRWECPVF